MKIWDSLQRLTTSNSKMARFTIFQTLQLPVDLSVPTFRGSLSIHMFMLLFRFSSESVGLPSNFTRKRKTALEIGVPSDKYV